MTFLLIKLSFVIKKFARRSQRAPPRGRFPRFEDKSSSSGKKNIFQIEMKYLTTTVNLSSDSSCSSKIGLENSKLWDFLAAIKQN